MRRLFFFVTLLVIPLLSGWVVAAPGPFHRPTRGPFHRPTFNYFKLALQWPPSICGGLPWCPNNFTIHGLWPDNFTGPFLKFCDNRPRYNTITRPLLRQMQSNWPNIKPNIKKQSNWPKIKKPIDWTFWRDEWMTHGTCSLSLYKQFDYFKLALKLKSQYDFLGHFRSHGITPGRFYTEPLIRSIVTILTFEKQPDLLCARDARQRLTLQEVRFCLDRWGRWVIDCPANHCSKTCSGDKDIYFPQRKTSVSF